MELRSQEFCSKALGGGVIQGEGARDCTGAMNEDKEDEADQELLRRQDPWKRQPDQLWRWERGEPDSLAFLVRCWRAGPSKCSSVFAVGRQGHGGGGGGARTRCQMASWPLQASARLMPFSAIQSSSRSQRAQSHHTKE